MKSPWLRLLFILVFLFMGLNSPKAQAATFTVSTTADSGTGSLRAAIVYANANPGTSIQFHIGGAGSGGPRVISINSMLPVITANGTKILGSTQSSYIDSNPNGPDIAIDATNYYDFLYLDGLICIQASNCSVEGLMFTHYSGTAIALGYGSSVATTTNTVKGCWFGIAADGKTASRQLDAGGVGPSCGVWLESTNSTIGGTTAAERNLFGGMGVTIDPETNAESFNSRGQAVVVRGSRNTIKGNYFGVAADGTAGLKSTVEIAIFSEGTTVTNNVLAAASQGISAYNATNTIVTNNYFGLNPATNKVLGSFTTACNFSGSSNTTLQNNLFVHCSFGGVISSVDSGNPTRSQIITLWGNTFGIDMTGNSVAPAVIGAMILTNNAQIGGTGAGQANIFDGCANAVALGGTSLPNNTGFYPQGINIRANIIRNSTYLPISIASSNQGPHGEDLNDTGDTDTGTNTQQNYPVLTSVEETRNGSVIISGTFNSLPYQTYFMDIYSNSKASATGFGEGERYLGSTEITTDASGNTSFKLPFSAGTAGEYISATVTDLRGNTSEFCAAMQGTAVPNRPPVVSKVTIKPLAPQTNSLLTATVNASDPDNDAAGFSYVWTKNGVVIPGETGYTLDLAKAGNGDRAETIQALVTVSDGLASVVGSSNTVTINNTAPVLAPGTFSLDSIEAGAANNAGTSIESIINSAGADKITDIDTGARQGIVLTGITQQEPAQSWQYSLDNGVSWTPVNFTTPLPLAADGKTRLRLIPTNGTTGEAHLSFRAWDVTLGFNGTPYKIISTGGISAFSAETGDLKCVVNPSDNPPTLTPGVSSVSIAEDTPGVGIILRVSDVDSDLSTVQVSATSSNDTLIPNSSLKIRLLTDSTTLKSFGVNFKPARDQNGSANLIFTATNAGKSATAILPVTVTPVNDAPILTATSPLQDANENQELVMIGLSATDVDAGDTYKLEATITGGTGHFGLQTEFSTNPVFTGDLAAVNQALAGFTYKSAENFSGKAYVAISLNDGTDGVAIPLEVNVKLVNKPPIISSIADQSIFLGDAASPVTFQIADPETPVESLQVEVTSSDTNFLANSALHLSATGADCTLSIDAPKDKTGTDGITIKVTDADGASISRTFTFTILERPANTAPVIEAPKSYSTSEDKSVSLTGIHLSDVDAGNGELTLSWTSTGGTVLLGTDKSPVSGTLAALNARLASGLTFVPTPNFNGSATLVLTLNDNGNSGEGGAKTATTTIPITVSPVNDSPQMSAVTFTGKENSTLTASLGAKDIDGDKLTFAITKKPSSGAIILKTDGTFSYRPNLNWNGIDTFQASATDPGKLTTSATFTLSIKPVNVKPIPTPDTVNGTEDLVLTIPAETLLKNDSNGEIRGENDPLRISMVSIPGGFPGTLRFDKVKQIITFTPKRNWNGTTTFKYTARDSGGAEASTTVTLIIAPVNDAPVAEEAHFKVVSGLSREIRLYASDIEKDSLTLSLSTLPENGIATLSKVGDKWILHYTAKSGFVGLDEFGFVANDGKLTSAPAPIHATVEAGTAPKNNGVTPNAAKIPAGSFETLSQKVRDLDGTVHISAVSLIVSNNPKSPDGKGGAVVWFNAVNNTFTLAKDDGVTYLPAASLGKTLENGQVKVTLSVADVQRRADGSITLNWHFTFKPGWIGLKTLWSRVEDLSLASQGFDRTGTLNLLATAPQMSSEDESLSATASSAKSS